jgi:hypothetical protein
MKEIKLKSLDDFIQHTKDYNAKITIYRGVTHEKYDLRPRIGRVEIKNNEKLNEVELRIFRRFQERSIPYLERQPNDEWEWLAVAQHHGLPTRLLDWSRNPLVAAYFAVERAILDNELEEHSGNNAIYVFKGRTVITKGNLSNINPKYRVGPFKIVKSEKFVPAYVDVRIIVQAGVFTIHPDPTAENPFKSEDIEKLIVPYRSRKHWKDRLHILGINRASLFPSLDDLTKHIEWLCTKCH